MGGTKPNKDISGLGKKGGAGSNDLSSRGAAKPVSPGPGTGDVTKSARGGTMKPGKDRC